MDRPETIKWEGGKFLIAITCGNLPFILVNPIREVIKALISICKR